MAELFAWSAAALSAGGAGFLLVLVVRRLQLSRQERRRADAETRLRSLALALTDGEAPDVALDARDGEALAALLSRFARRLDGTGRAHIAAFFERHGQLSRELERLRDRRSWRRATAAFALGDMASPRAVPSLVEALNDPRREVRAAAARSLGRLAAVEAVEPLVYALADERVPRAVAGQALLDIGPAALPELRALEARTRADVRAVAVELVGPLGNASDGHKLLERLRDPSADVRAKAALALGRLGADVAAADLRNALADRMPLVRAAAATALGAIGDRDAVGALLRETSDEHFESARAAAEALARIAPGVLEDAAGTAGASPHVAEAADLLRVAA